MVRVRGSFASCLYADCDGTEDVDSFDVVSSTDVGDLVGVLCD